MSYVTTHLDDESGIQYQGVQDKTNINQISDLSNMLMLAEDLPRGRMDKEMTITKANIRAVIGSGKTSLAVQAIEDALDTGVERVQVLRIIANGTDIEVPGGGGDSISCDGATPQACTGYISGNGMMYINDVEYPYLADIPEMLYIDSTDEFAWYWHNLTNEPMRIRIETDLDGINPSEKGWEVNTNPTLNVNFDTGTLEVCLSPYEESSIAISCDGATPYVSFSSNGSGYDIQVNNVLHGLNDSNIGLFFKEKFSDIIDCYAVDGVIRLDNISSNPIRIAFIPIKEYARIVPDLESNPTYMEHENGTHTFCLAPLVLLENYPPYAEIATSIPWGQAVDVEITVGETISTGATYSGDLLNEVIDKLSENHGIHTALRATYDNFDNRYTSIVFAGDIYSDNLKVELTIKNVGANANAPDMSNFPTNETLEVFSATGLATFNIGVLICDSGTRQEHTTQVSSEDYPLIYGKSYSLGVAKRMGNMSLATPKTAGVITGNWDEYCATTQDPDGCKNSNLTQDLFQQWNPQLEPIGVQGILARHSHYIMPIGAEINGSSIVVPFVIKPSADVGIQDMWHVGYVIPMCLQPE